MKPEQTEKFLIEELFKKTQEKNLLTQEAMVEVDKLTGDASTRRYYRVFTENKSYVVCLDNPFEGDQDAHPFVSVQKFLKENKIAVPEVIDHNLTRGYLLQEDLGDTTLLNHLGKICSDQEELTIYKSAIDQILAMHRVAPDAVSSQYLFQHKFDYQKLMDEIKFTFKYFMNFFNKNSDEHLIKELEELFSPLVRRLSEQKMVITHRDFHSRNIMIKDEKLILIDFQDARWGIPQYDLVSLLEDCYYDVSDENRKILKKYYFDNLDLKIHGQESFDQFNDLYNDMLIQRVFKAVGSFCYIYNWRKDERYLKYIGFAMEKIRKVMMGQPRYLSLKSKIFQHYYAN